MKHRIFVKLLAAFGAVMLLFSLVLGGVFLALFRSHTLSINRTAMEKQAVSIADTLSSFRRGMMGYGAYLRFLDKLTLADVWIVDEGLRITTCGPQEVTVRYDELSENAQRIVDRVLAGVSHELRTPVAVLRGSVELLRDGTVSAPEEVAEYYAQMLAESRHLERLVNDLLELSRLQDEGFRLQMEEVNLCDAARDAARAIRPAAQARGIAVETALPETECPLRGDYGRLRQLMLILLDNAVKFSREGENVRLSLQKAEDCVLTVTDRGAEIPPEELPHIFDRFYKTGAKENKNGTGLGLAIASEIVRRHGAEISAGSGGGATSFRVVFPRSADRDVAR